MDHSRTSNRPIGSPVERLEDLRFLRGRGEFVDDVSSPGALHAVILRSSVAHGRLRGVDASVARKCPGVRAVITAQDIGEIPVITMRQELLPEFKPYQQPVIAGDKVRYVGEPIAVVVADSTALAEDALEHIALDIEALPPVADRAAARKTDSLLFEETGRNHVITLSAKLGDAAAAFHDAPYTRRERFQVQRFTAVTMEPRGLLAEWDDANGHLTVSGMTKVVFHNRRILAKQMGLAEDAITMIEADVGGGFGVRGEFYPEDFLIPFAARTLKRAVKWIEDRRENLIASNHARDAECELEIACDRDGTIRGLRGHGAADLGAYIRTNGVTAARNTAQVLSGPYRVSNIQFEMALLLTNKTPSGTYRGPGRFEADFFRERLFDMAANDLGIDRVEFRRRNLVAEHEMPWTLPTIQPLDQGGETDNGDYRQTLDRCLKDFGWPEKSALQGKLIDGRRHGIAIGCYLEGGGSGPRENVRMVLERDGTVSLYTGSSSVGQGVETVMAQIAADALDMPMARINRVQHGSTTVVTQGYGSYSSRSIVMGGSAIVQAAGLLKDAIRAAAAKRLQCAPSDIAIDGDNAVGPDRASVALSALAVDGIAADGTYASSKRTYSYGAHAAHVAVDPGTGHVALIDYMAVEDVGRIINPLTLHGQAVGAIVQGLGGALLEHLAYDSAGQFLSGTLADYLLPTASDFPVIRAHAMEERPAPHNPLGAKGAGEGGIIPVGGVIANAIANALGVEPNILPLSPPRVWELMNCK
ncbi:MAG: xanthine dehydrogenase family protein molybdopterin-binding subunit [Hyphomicrobiales bacterium]|nr:xanthine dehydrogenase family protein molybdopterin-binding subunit [Alphaproteobacteria bacterium]